MKKILLIFIFLSSFHLHTFTQNKFTSNFDTNEDTTLVILEANVDGESHRFIFDTGAEISVLFLKDNFNLSKKRQVTAIDVFGKESEVSIIKKKIKIPSLKATNKGYCLIMDNKPDFMNRLNIDGIIGADLINKYDWKLDLKKLKITKLQKKEIPDNIFDYYVLPTHFKNERSRIIETNVINESDTASFTIDTGANLIIAAYKQDSLIENNRNIRLKAYTYNFTVSNSYVRDTSFISSEDITLGDLNISNIPFSNRRKAGTNNTVGMAFFKPFSEFYILNSKSELLIPRINSYQYQFKTFKIDNEIIISQYQLFNEDKKSYLGKSTNELNEDDIKILEIPITKYK